MSIEIKEKSMRKRFLPAWPGETVPAYTLHAMRGTEDGRSDCPNFLHPELAIICFILLRHEKSRSGCACVANFAADVQWRAIFFG